MSQIRTYLSEDSILQQISKPKSYEQLDLFTDYKAIQKKNAEEEAALSREKKIQEAFINLKKMFGKNAVLKGMNRGEGASAASRNQQIGGHKA